MSHLSNLLTIYVGDCLAVMQNMKADSVDCVVTSPPYWGLRDYGVEGQLGMEQSLGEHINVMVAVFEEVRRILKPSGTLWLNYGDCYATTPNGRTAKDLKSLGTDDRTFRDKPFSTVGPIYVPDHEKGERCGQSGNKGSKGQKHHTGRVVAGGFLKSKDLCMVPNRIAIALQEAGWWVRSEIIWAKPNPMPESVTDRPATSHEKIWLLTKSAKYFYDNEAVRQGRTSNENAVTFRGGLYVGGNVGKRKNKGNKKFPAGWARDGKHTAIAHNKGTRIRGSRLPHQGLNEKWDVMSRNEQQANGRNLRNYEPAPLEVWRMATRPFREAHFATFPPELAERCILAGCPKSGVVFDPFGGAGTTALVALRHGRKAVMIELNPEYAEISRRRIEAEWKVQPKQLDDFGPLFKNCEMEEQ